MQHKRKKQVISSVLAFSMLFCCGASSNISRAVDQHQDTLLAKEGDWEYYMDSYYDDEETAGYFGEGEKVLEIPQKIGEYDVDAVHFARHIINYDAPKGFKEYPKDETGLPDNVETLKLSPGVKILNSWYNRFYSVYHMLIYYRFDNYMDLLCIAEPIDGKGLSNYEVPDENPYYSEKNGVLFSKDGSHLLDYPDGRREKKYTVPNGTDTVCYAAFQHNPYIESVVIPYSVNSMCITAFEWVDNLKKIYIPVSTRIINKDKDIPIKPDWGSNVTIYCQKGSHAEKFAKKYKYRYKSYYKPGKVTIKSKKIIPSGKKRISWNEVNTAAGYQIYRKDARNGEWKRVSTFQSKSSTVYKEPADGMKKVWYKVRAFRKAGPGKIYGRFSRPICIITIK